MDHIRFLGLSILINIFQIFDSNLILIISYDKLFDYLRIFINLHLMVKSSYFILNLVLNLINKSISKALAFQSHLSNFLLYHHSSFKEYQYHFSI
jgi:hypothetical protein